MNQRLIRIYQYFDINDIKDKLLIVGDLSGQCSKCNHLGVKLDSRDCPECHTVFKFITFRNIKDHLPKVQKLKHERPDVVLVDHDDFKRQTGALKAEEFLK